MTEPEAWTVVARYAAWTALVISLQVTLYCIIEAILNYRAKMLKKFDEKEERSESLEQEG